MMGRTPQRRAALATILATAGRTKEAEDILADLETIASDDAGEYVSSADIAMVHGALGNLATAIE